MTHFSALVQPVSPAQVLDWERRRGVRFNCDVEALARPMDIYEGMSWGAVVRDLSTGGLRLSLCYPFKPGTYLAVDLHGQGGMGRTVLARVVHVRDQLDGAWNVGCEFVRSLSDSDVAMLV